MAGALDILSWVCLSIGTLAAVVGGIGVVRLPDVFTRMHASSMTDTLGTGLILLGLAFQSGVSLATVKLASVLLFLLVTAPTAAHALARAALARDVEPWIEPEAAEESPSPR